MTRLSTGQRLSIIAAAGLVAAGLAIFALLSRPDYGPLYSRLSPDEAAQVVAKLEADGIPYRITGGGTVIAVPQDRLYSVRLQLAAEGLPRGGVGFELFDKTAFGASDVAQRVNFQRALQGELVRTIETMAEIESARVHLALPRDRLFTDEASRPSASVVLKILPGATLSPKQIRAITHLVAGSVEGLSPERVTVVDARGALLSSGQEEVAGLGAATLAAREQVEVAIEHRLQTMLDQVLGPGRSVVRVSAEIDLSRRQVQEESFVQNNRTPRSEVSIEETYEGRGGPPGGPGGASPPLPSYTTTTGATGSQYRRRETRTAYEVARRIEQATSAGGGIRRLSVAVLVDRTVPPDQVSALKTAVAAGVGIDPSRGDAVAVQPVSFPAPPAPSADTSPSQSREAGLGQQPLVAVLGGVGVALVAATITAVLLARRRRPRVQTLHPTALPQAGQGQSPTAGAPADEEERILAALRQRQQEQPEAVVLRREVQRLARERSADAAAIVKSWLASR